MTLEIGNIVVLKNTLQVQYNLDDFVGKIKRREWGDRVVLIPLSDSTHPLYNQLTPTEIERDCGFNTNTFVHERKTHLIQSLLEGVRV